MENHPWFFGISPVQNLPGGIRRVAHTKSYWKWHSRNSGFSHENSMVDLSSSFFVNVYQRVYPMMFPLFCSLFFFMLFICFFSACSQVFPYCFPIFPYIFPIFPYIFPIFSQCLSHFFGWLWTGACQDNQDSQAPWTGRPSGVATPAGCGQEISLGGEESTRNQGRGLEFMDVILCIPNLIWSNMYIICIYIYIYIYMWYHQS